MGQPNIDRPKATRAAADDAAPKAPGPCSDILPLVAALARLAARRQKLSDWVAETHGEAR